MWDTSGSTLYHVALCAIHIMFHHLTVKMPPQCCTQKGWNTKIPVSFYKGEEQYRPLWDAPLFAVFQLLLRIMLRVNMRPGAFRYHIVLFQQTCHNFRLLNKTRKDLESSWKKVFFFLILSLPSLLLYLLPSPASYHFPFPLPHLIFLFNPFPFFSLLS